MCLNVFTLAVALRVCEIFPFFKIIIDDLLFLRFYHDSHSILSRFIASASSYSRFSEVHDIEGIVDTFSTSFGFKVEPLLMTSCVCVNLHVEIISVL
jgi:hypothetical protein